MTFFEFQQKFPNQKKIIEYFLKIRYGAKIRCNHCNSEKVYQRHTNLKVFNCSNCNNTFSPFKDTIFEKSSTDLIKWMYAIHLFLNGKKGISAKQLQREIGVTYKTAWRMFKQIRIAMGNTETKKAFEATVEMDETYIGGKPRKKNKDGNNKNKRGRGTKKIPIVGIINRNSKKVYCKVALPNKEGQKLTGKQLLNILNEICKKNTVVITDEFRGYKILKKTKQFIHLVINHTDGFVNGLIHTNNIESFWATIKRGVYGIYHHISIKYMQNYINEFSFRYNNRDKNMFDIVLKQAVL